MSDKAAAVPTPGPLAALMAEIRSARSGRPIDRDIALMAGEVTVAEQWAKKPLSELMATMAATHDERDRMLAEAMKLGGQLQKLEERRAHAERGIRVLAQAIALKAATDDPA